MCCQRSQRRNPPGRRVLPLRARASRCHIDSCGGMRALPIRQLATPPVSWLILSAFCRVTTCDEGRGDRRPELSASVHKFLFTCPEALRCGEVAADDPAPQAMISSGFGETAGCRSATRLVLAYGQLGLFVLDFETPAHKSLDLGGTQ